MRRLLVTCSLSLLILSPGLLAAQKADPHFVTARIAPTAKRSAFVHGYLHGYEEGFHQADFDLHMGRIARGQYTRDGSPSGYRRQFGSKSMFDAGYKQGYRVGYADAANERSFRAVENVVTATGQVVEDVPASAAFDEGMRSGYTAGQHQGLDDARRQVENRPSPSCPLSKGTAQPEYCTAYTSGYGMGYSDGFTNQAKTAIAEAKK